MEKKFSLSGFLSLFFCWCRWKKCPELSEREVQRGGFTRRGMEKGERVGKGTQKGVKRYRRKTWRRRRRRRRTFGALKKKKTSREKGSKGTRKKERILGKPRRWKESESESGRGSRSSGSRWRSALSKIKMRDQGGDKKKPNQKWPRATLVFKGEKKFSVFIYSRGYLGNFSQLRRKGQKSLPFICGKHTHPHTHTHTFWVLFLQSRIRWAGVEKATISYREKVKGKKTITFLTPPHTLIF